MKRLFTSPILLVLALSLPVLGFSWYVATRNVDEASLLDTDPSILRNRTRLVGGVERPLSDIADPLTAEFAPPDGAKDRQPQDISYTHGEVTCPKVRKLTRGMNKQMDSVIDALETGKFPERVSPWIQSLPFDREAFAANPRVYRSLVAATSREPKQDGSKSRFFVQAEGDPSYLDVVEPGRIYDIEQPGEGVPVLQNLTLSRSIIQEGESVALRVQTVPLAPVSFTAFNVCAFDNGLTSITVASDEQGVAVANFTGTTSPFEVDIIAGSPMASGNVRFVVDVQAPAPTE